MSEEIVIVVLKNGTIIMGELLNVENDTYYFSVPLQLVTDFEKNPPKLIPFTYPLPTNHLYLKNIKNIEKIYKTDMLKMYTSEELLPSLIKDYKKYVREMKNPDATFQGNPPTIH